MYDGSRAWSPRGEPSRTKWRRMCSKDICTPPRRSFGPAATRTHSRWYNRHGASVGAAAYCARVAAVSAQARSGSRVSEVRRQALAKPSMQQRATWCTTRANVYRVRAAWRAPRIMSTAPPCRPAVRLPAGSAIECCDNWMRVLVVGRDAAESPDHERFTVATSGPDRRIPARREGDRGHCHPDSHLRVTEASVTRRCESG